MSNRRAGGIFVISAPSGSGKTTLTRRLLKNDRKLVQSVSVTTRSPRKGERKGRDYYFVTKKQFKSMIAGKKFLEWAENFGNFYGTPRKFVEGAAKKGKDMILSIDVQGALQVKKRKPGAVFIFIVPPSREELKKRLRKRNTERKSSIKMRLKVADREMALIPEYDYVVINDSVERALRELRSIIRAERRKVKES